MFVHGGGVGFCKLASARPRATHGVLVGVEGVGWEGRFRHSNRLLTGLWGTWTCLMLFRGGGRGKKQKPVADSAAVLCFL